MPDPRARAIAFYLPQFHPVPENDAWWGPGFTEWRNVARARPLFRGHRQPHHPGDLGFYDLRIPEVRQAQADLAAAHGIAAFAYWHYWFGHGRRILERPFAEVLAAGAPALPFCLAWANETWSGSWHGADGRVLIEQTYPGPQDDRAHFDTVLPAFRDPRYLRVGDRPVFYVLRPENLPDPAAFVDRWQAMARAAGLPGLYLVAEVSHWFDWGYGFTDVRAAGFDTGVDMYLPARFDRRDFWRRRILRRVGRGPERYVFDPRLLGGAPLAPDMQPVVYPQWDNTPRSGRHGFVLTGTTPAGFADQVRQAVDALADRPAAERLLWVKSWNEWAEGNYLEPDLVHGDAWLRALAAGLGVPRAASPVRPASSPGPAGQTGHIPT